MAGKLYLIPNTLGDDRIALTIPTEVATLTCRLRFFIVENLRTTRRYLRALDKTMDIDGSTFFILDKHTTDKEFAEYLKPLRKGHDMGIISEAGCPGVADPGASVVKLAHQQDIEVIPLVGPSSILLALMASGMNGQNFAFNGYLPIQKEERIKTIKQLEARVHHEGQTQLFIETPYRNTALAQDLVSTCRPDTLIGIACNLTLPDGFVLTKSASAWKGHLPDIHKKPTIFLISGTSNQ
jgi:16S rRNA (cytidine1402-2'-O)-methyltransferase